MRGHDSTTGVRLWKVEAGVPDERADRVATEEPLEIRLRWAGSSRVVAVTMRTPGADRELAAGFLHGEGVVLRPERILGFAGAAGMGEGEDPDAANRIEVELGEGPEPQWQGLERHFFVSSACGVCGKAGLAALAVRVSRALPPGPVLAPQLIVSLPARLRQAQGLFAATGGLHAAALFDPEGRLLAVYEDVGRHNALDKLVGWALLAGRLPLSDHVVLVSGRTSFEILQKCVVAGVPVVCGVSAPSSLAVELAERFGVTLIGFLRGDRFNLYSSPERIAGLPSARRARLPVVLTSR
jgi:FdhD protein